MESHIKYNALINRVAEEFQGACYGVEVEDFVQVGHLKLLTLTFNPKYSEDAKRRFVERSVRAAMVREAMDKGLIHVPEHVARPHFHLQEQTEMNYDKLAELLHVDRETVETAMLVPTVEYTDVVDQAVDYDIYSEADIVELEYKNLNKDDKRILEMSMMGLTVRQIADYGVIKGKKGPVSYVTISNRLNNIVKNLKENLLISQ